MLLLLFTSKSMVRVSLPFLSSVLYFPYRMCHELISNIFLEFFLSFTERVHDPNSNLDAQRGILNKSPEKLSEYLSI